MCVYVKLSPAATFLQKSVCKNRVKMKLKPALAAPWNEVFISHLMKFALWRLSTFKSHDAQKVSAYFTIMECLRVQGKATCFY